MCDICPLAKQRKLFFLVHTQSTSVPFQLIHVDIWGPYEVPTLLEQRFFLTVVDDFSQFNWVFLMRNKSEVATIIPTFDKYVQKQFDKLVKCIRSDNGNEFRLINFFTNIGIIHQLSCANSPQ